MAGMCELGKGRHGDRETNRVGSQGNQMIEAELIEYINEHFVYELLMLRYSMYHLERCQDQLLWNAMFAAINVSARNIYEFFANKHTTSVRLVDFQGHHGTFRRSSIEKIKGTLEKLNAQCFHLGKRRTRVSRDKVTLERIRELFEWAESNVLAFIQSLNFKDAIDLSGADLESRVKMPALMVRFPGMPSGTNIPEIVTTSSVSFTFFNVPKDEQK